MIVLKFLKAKAPLWIAILMLSIIISCNDQKEIKAPIPEIQVVEVFQKDVPIYREFVGQVYGEKDIPIRARVEGFLEGIHFKEGLQVTKGQLLYTIDPEPFDARVNSQKSKLAEAKTMLVKAENDLNRYKPLAEINAVSESDLDAAQAYFDAALSSVDAATANLRSAEIELGYCRISSPISGIIGKTLAREGDFVGREPNPVILNTVSKTDNVRVTFFLTESEYLTISRAFTDDIKLGSRDELEPEDKATLQLLLSDGTTYKHTGTVDFIDRGVDATTGSILIQASFPNPDLLLRPGLYSKVKIEMSRANAAVLIPQRCVMELQGQFSAYVVNSDNIVESRQLKIGPNYNDYVIITEGLKENEKVVIDGLQKVKSGVEINPQITVFDSKFQE